MTKKNKDASSPIQAPKTVLGKEDIGGIFAAEIAGDKGTDCYKLTVKCKDADSEENRSTFEGFIKKAAFAQDTPKENLCVKLIALEEDGCEFVLNDAVISYHTFMFPFLFEMNKKNTRKKFETCCHPGWFPDVWNPNEMKDAIWYNQYHYFNKAAHNTIYMPKDYKDVPEAIVRNLRFDLLSLTDENPKADPQREKKRPKNVSNRIKYVIRKGDKTYRLDVNAIRMKLYNTGVGILIFELENRTYLSEKDIVVINDFGRRIYAPYYGYVPRKKFKCDPRSFHKKKVRKNESPRHYKAGRDLMFCSICADELYFEINNKKEEIAKDSFALIQKKLRTSADTTVLAEPIRRLLSNGERHVTTEKTCGKNELYIQPIIDDRMFVACYYKNNDFVDSMREWDGDRYRYMTHAASREPFDNEKNANTAHRLYTMMYADGDGICCHGRDMLQKHLSDDHIYTRWLENAWHDDKNEKITAGTITGFSEYAMISVAKDPPDHLADAFLTQYIEMAILALAQRASLLALGYMVSECAYGGNYKIDTIQKKYTLFQSQILLKEVSSQQQAIEVYDMLEKNLMIEKEQNVIKEQIAGLFEQKNFYHNAMESQILFWLTVFGSVEAFSIVVDMLCDAETSHWILKLLVFSPLAIAAFILSRILYNRGK